MSLLSASRERGTPRGVASPEPSLIAPGDSGEAPACRRPRSINLLSPLGPACGEAGGCSEALRSTTAEGEEALRPPVLSMGGMPPVRRDRPVNDMEARRLVESRIARDVWLEPKTSESLLSVLPFVLV